MPFPMLRAWRSTTVTRLGVCALGAIPYFAVPLRGQTRSEDRRKFLDSTTATTDDPRHTPVRPGPRGPGGAIVLRGGRVFDATGAPAREATVVIEGNHIARILPAGAQQWPAGARVIDVPGMTVMPGLVDLHTHLTYATSETPGGESSDADATLRAVERLRYFIESGVTSVRGVASHNDVPFVLKRWVRDRRIPGPRVFAAGKFITGRGGHGAEGGLVPGSTLFGAVRVASGPDGWREAVRENFDAGADVIKIGSHFSRDEVRAAVEEAHALGLRVTCDCETFYIQWAVEAGVDAIEHPLPRSDETIRLMAQRGVASDPTLVPYIYIFDLEGGYWGSTSRRFTFSKAANLTMLRRLKEAGVKLGVGTDLIADWYRYLPAPYITELKQFVAAGFTIPEALAAATRTNAQILDMGDKLGTLDAGKLADVLVVRGRPDQDLNDLANVYLVIRDGEIVVEDGHLAIPRHVPVPEPAPKTAAKPVTDGR